MIVFVEPQWKPSTEDQAAARAHRMGQVRTVQVHRLLAKDSIDERIVEIQDGKRRLFDEFARRIDAKDADHRAVAPSVHRPERVEVGAADQQRILGAELRRFGLAPAGGTN